jgi:hypothetical protein
LQRAFLESKDAEAFCERITSTLEHLRALDPTAAPPRSAYLKPTDFKE